jgi:riboflavin kinase / FMN adenylyltransferase
MPTADVVASVTGLERRHGRLALVVGVFDGLHLGHAHLLRALVEWAATWRARPAVVTFDAHPDAVLRGEAPPLLLDPTDRVRLLADAGVEVIVVEHFDDRLRTTPYDAFVHAITSRVELAGFVMTPDTAFGFERRGTPDTVATLGATTTPHFTVAVVDPLRIDGRPVSSSEIRRLVRDGRFHDAKALLGRPYAIVGEFDPATARLHFPMPVALPAPGEYAGSVASQPVVVHVLPDGAVRLASAGLVAGRLAVVFDTL